MTYKDIGTLAEIGAQVGDVVSCHNEAHDGTEFEVRHGFEEWSGYGRPWWRIVSRASDYQPDDNECVEAAMAKGIDYPAKPKGPVITETVKRIVPGVYGKVYVFGHVTEGLLVAITDKTDERDLDGYDCVTLTRAELIAARDVFNQLIDALP